MGIRIKNLHNYILRLRVNSTLSATTDKDCVVAPFAGQISNVFSTFTTLGTAAHPILDVHKNGTTIFSASTKITGTTTSGVMSYSALSSPNVDAGDIFTLDVDTSGTAAVNATVLITITRTDVPTNSTLSDHDQIL
jgi:hypothetical protein